MQRIITIFMLFTYLLFNAGISYSMHFCGDRLTSTEVFAKKKGCLCSSPKEVSHSCCKDVKVESAGNDQKVTSLFKLSIEKVLIGGLKFSIPTFINLFVDSEMVVSGNDSHPPLYKVPLFILNKTFRI
jgi:hypothetical protein